MLHILPTIRQLWGHRSSDPSNSPRQSDSSENAVVNPNSSNKSRYSFGRNDPDTDENPFELVEHALTHILLPRHIPDSVIQDAGEQETTLLIRMSETVRLAKWLPPNTVQMFETFEKIHFMAAPEVIEEAINELRPGHTFAMFVRGQNTVFLCHMPSDASDEVNGGTPDTETPIIVATFPGSVSMQRFYKESAELKVITSCLWFKGSCRQIFDII